MSTVVSTRVSGEAEMRIVGISGQMGSGKDTVAAHLVEHHDYLQMALADPIKRLGKYVFAFTNEQLWGPSECRNAVDDRYTLCEIRSSNTKFGPGLTTKGLAKVCDGGWLIAAKALLEYGPEWLEEVLPDRDVNEEMKILCKAFASLGHKYPELSPRVMLQYFGTEWGRDREHGIWVKCLFRNATKVLKGHGYRRDVGVGGLSYGSGVIVSDIRFKDELEAFKDVGGKLIRIHRKETDEDAAKIGISCHPSEQEQKEFKDDMFDVIIQNNGSLKELLKNVDDIAVVL